MAEPPCPPPFCRQISITSFLNSLTACVSSASVGVFPFIVAISYRLFCSVECRLNELYVSHNKKIIQISSVIVDKYILSVSPLYGNFSYKKALTAFLLTDGAECALPSATKSPRPSYSRLTPRKSRQSSGTISSCPRSRTLGKRGFKRVGHGTGMSGVHSEKKAGSSRETPAARIQYGIGKSRERGRNKSRNIPAENCLGIKHYSPEKEG